MTITFSDIQYKLKCNKSQFNSFGKYNYRNLEDILEAAKPLLHEAGMYLVVGDEIVNLGNRFYVRATATIYDAENKAIARNAAFAREPEVKKGMDEAQITGATSSYARKYCLNGLFCLDDTKDADTNEQRKESQGKAYMDKHGGGPYYYSLESVGDLNKAEEYMDKMGAVQVVPGQPLWKSDKSCAKVHNAKCLLTKEQADEMEEHLVARVTGEDYGL